MANRLLAVLIVLFGCVATSHAQTSRSVSVRPVAGGVSVRSTDADTDVVVLVDGKNVNADSIEVHRGGQIMVWLRELEKLGWGVVDSGPGDEVRFRGRGVTLAFTKGQGVARVNSLAVKLPIDTYLRDGKLMVPISFVAKALGFEYESAPKTVVAVKTSPSPRTNSIIGTVLYDGKGVPGITVRVTDAEFTVVKNVMARTDASGGFVLSPLPDGRFMAYVYTGDNPTYFNRASEIAELKGGQEAQLKPIVLGRILLPVSPKSGSKLSLSKPRLDFAWTACPGAASYKVHFGPVGKIVPDIDAVAKKPSLSIESSRFSAGLSYAAEVTALDAQGRFLGGTAGDGSSAWTFTAGK